jgi:membrane protease YdiL (CAAX protease family)
VSAPAASSLLRPLPRERVTVQVAGLVLAGLALLALRPVLAGSPSAGIVLVATYLALGAAAVAIPAPAGEPIAARWVVLTVGLGAVLSSTLAAGLPPPAPLAAAALPMNSLAAVSEEAFFRRFLYGRLVTLGAIPAVAGSAVLFALVHLPAYGLAALPIDLAAGVLLSWQRWAAGSWTVPAATHVAANLMAVLR